MKFYELAESCRTPSLTPQSTLPIPQMCYRSACLLPMKSLPAPDDVEPTVIPPPTLALWARFILLYLILQRHPPPDFRHSKRRLSVSRIGILHFLVLRIKYSNGSENIAGWSFVIIAIQKLALNTRKSCSRYPRRGLLGIPVTHLWTR